MISLSTGAKIVTGAFVVSGVIHLVRPRVFEPAVPRSLSYKRELVYASGVAELACAAGVLAPRTRHIAGPASAALLVAVFPANIQMAVDAHEVVTRKGSTTKREALRAVAFARLPLQLPMIAWMWRAGRSAD